MKHARFTIIEILVVITIIIILAGLLFPVIRATIITSREARVQADFTRIVYLLDTQKEEDGYLPLSVTADPNLLQPPRFPTIRVLDPDGFPYVYKHEKGAFQIIWHEHGGPGKMIETVTDRSTPAAP